MKKLIISYLVVTVLVCFIFYTAAFAQGSKKTLEVGDQMPAFTLLDQDGKPFKSADHVGAQMLVIYFYPKDESMVCTKEACAFRDSFDEFTKAGAKVIGINGGTVESHKEFQQHYKLPFVLLSDPDNKIYKQFGVKNKFFMTGRETFIIDKKGKIVYAYEAMMQGKEHADDALKFIKSDRAK